MSAAENTIATLRSRGYQVVNVGAAMMALAITAVGLRFIAKTMGEKKRWGWDDALIGFALLTYISDQSMIIYAVHQGAAAVSSESPEWSRFTLFVYVYSMLYWTIIAFVTFSILFLYRKIFAAHHAFSICSYVIAAIVTVWWVTGTIIDAISYWPARAYWDFSVTGGYIINYDDFWIGDMIIELFFEAAVILLPVLEISKLNLDTRKKIFMVAMFAMGGFVLITGILRIHYAWRSSDMIPGTIWLGVHGSVAIISACLPTYRPILAKIPGLIPTTRRSSNFGYMSWRSRRKDSIDAHDMATLKNNSMDPAHDTATLKPSISLDQNPNTTHKPHGIADLDLHELEVGHKFSLAAPARDGVIDHTLRENAAHHSDETLREIPSLGPIQFGKPFLS